MVGGGHPFKLVRCGPQTNRSLVSSLRFSLDLSYALFTLGRRCHGFIGHIRTYNPLCLARAIICFLERCSVKRVIRLFSLRYSKGHMAAIQLTMLQRVQRLRIFPNDSKQQLTKCLAMSQPSYGGFKAYLFLFE